MPRRVSTALAVAATLTLVAPPFASAGRLPQSVGHNASATDAANGTRERPGHFDLRRASVGGEDTLAPEVARQLAAATRGLRRSTGRAEIQVDIDPATGTPAHLTATDGYLTPPSDRVPELIVRTYLRDNAEALGLSPADLRTFRLRQSDTDASGVTHVTYEQVSRGIPVFGNGLKAHLTRQGELISLQGSPIGDLDALTADIRTRPDMTAAAARTAAAEDVGGSVDSTADERSDGSAASSIWSNGDRAEVVWFVGADNATLSWSTYTQASDTLTYSHVIGEDGRVLYRNDLVDFADSGDARAYDNHPGAVRGGAPRIVDLVANGWISPRAPWLRGPNVSAWADLDDDNAVDERERTPLPGRDGRAQFVLEHFDDNDLCNETYVCTWDPETAYSWHRNKRADVTNAFYLANRFHDWLARPAIGFDARAGNFERNGGDPVLLQAMDGADTDGGLPDADHVNDANMATPPDGLPPVMQMYLLHEPAQPNSLDPYLPTSGSFEAETLFHEYAHGLSNRLVTDASGNSTLNSVQAGAMGEAWSDYYAMDYLVHKGFVRDTERDGQLRAGSYAFGGEGGWRTQSVDCDPDSTARNCTRLDDTKGGYTYGDFPSVGSGGPAVHASGEIWAQTLWDVRETLGSVAASRIITQAMRLSPADPSMLNMRNSILQADQVINDGANNLRLWRLFAARGMGWYAGTTDASDAFPAESFRIRPRAELAPGALEGTLTDGQTGEPVKGIRVVIAGHGDTFADTTGANGRFFIGEVPVGTYPKVTVAGRGYAGFTRAVTIRSGGVRDLTGPLRRDWAAASGGAAVVDVTGPDYTDYGCGPWNAIDLSQGTGWGSTTGTDDAQPTGAPVPKSITIKLPEPVDISAAAGADVAAFRVDPSSTCGDPGSSSTNEYRIEVSTDDGFTWEEAADGAFGTSPSLSRGRYFDVASDTAVAGVTQVRFWMDSPQVPDIATNCPDGSYGGCEYMGMSEIQVYGTPAG